jgi:hypothetical protein
MGHPAGGGVIHWQGGLRKGPRGRRTESRVEGSDHCPIAVRSRGPSPQHSLTALSTPHPILSPLFTLPRCQRCSLTPTLAPRASASPSPSPQERICPTRNPSLCQLPPPPLPQARDGGGNHCLSCLSCQRPPNSLSVATPSLETEWAFSPTPSIDAHTFALASVHAHACAV